MKIAYLAPELPALSATFVYNEILQLESLGTQVVPFSVHKAKSNIKEVRVQALVQKTLNLYAQSNLSVITVNIQMLFTHPVRYIKTLGLLCGDMWQVGLFSRTAFGLGYRMMYAASLAKHLMHNKCDHLHIHFAHIPTDIGMYAASLSEIPYSVTAHANDIYERGWLLKQKVERSAFFATISEFNKQYLATKGVALGKVKIIRCGVDPAQFSPRQGFTSGDTIKIGVVGRLVEKKGIDTLINATSILKQQGVDVELNIVGSGPLEAELMALSESKKLNSKDIVFFGAMPHKKVAEFITSLDVFVLSCQIDGNGDMDGIPVVLMEAMLSGVPVISTQVSGIPELVIDRSTGLLVKANDEAALAKAIYCMITDETLRAEIIQNAIVKVSHDFSLAINTRRLHFLFLNATNEGA